MIKYILNANCVIFANAYLYSKFTLGAEARHHLPHVVVSLGLFDDVASDR